MLGRLTWMLAAVLGFLAGFLLATNVAPGPSHHPRGRARRSLSPLPRQPPRPARAPSGRRAAAADGQRSARKPARRKSKSRRPKKNP